LSKRGTHKTSESAFTEWVNVPQTAAVAIAMKEAVTPEFEMLSSTIGNM
jgi:hypothetical protein